MSTRHLRVTADQRDQVCSLTVAGELDVTSADEFQRYVVQAVDEQTERLVFDLAELTFVDCCGARALRAAPGSRPVTVRAISQPVRRFFTLLGLDLGDGCSEAEQAAEELVARARRTRARWQAAAAQAERIAEAIAVTGDRVAVTLIRVAAQ